MRFVGFTKEGKLTPLQARIFQQPRPREELYDLRADPNEVNNLAEDRVIRKRFSSCVRS
jgi:hypothetical protein